MTTDKRERILKAAIKVFARDGFFLAKVEEIAKVADVATGTIYLYFENKDDLMISIFEEEMLPIIEHMRQELTAHESATDKLIVFINQHLNLIQDHPDMAQLMQVELRQSSKFLHGYEGTRFREYLAIIGDIFKLGQAQKEFRDDINPSIFKQVLFGAVDQIATNWTLSKTKRIHLAASAQQISAIILRGVAKQ
ncbi:MAG TPA: TetR/AcrR family transcriptional regulator [bacterium]|nr:TetR/AcrR family transcriptional regulator [bacterium]